VFAYDFEGKRYDVGEKIGFVKTTVEFALQNEELRAELLACLDEVMANEKVK
jgi:UTP--glucose-1-phosphate uridylyltransferase